MGKRKLAPGITRRADGQIEVIASVVIDRQRRTALRVLPTETPLSKAAALREELIAQLRAALQGDLAPPQAPPQAPTLLKYFKSWIRLRAARVVDLTTRNYARTFANYILPYTPQGRQPWADWPLDRFTRDDLEGFVAALDAGRWPAGRRAPLAVGTRRQIWSTLLTVLRDGLATYRLWDATARVKGPQGTPRPAGRAYSAAELQTILRAVLTDRVEADNRGSTGLGVLFLVLATTGLRRSEAARQRWADLELDDPQDAWIVVSASKTHAGQGRRVPLLPMVAQALIDWRRKLSTGEHLRLAHTDLDATSSPWVWPHRDAPDRHVHPDSITGSFRRLSKATGIADLSPHNLRRTFATLARREGLSSIVIKGLVGHTDEKMTEDYYIRLSDEDRALARETFSRLLGVRAEPQPGPETTPEAPRNDPEAESEGRASAAKKSDLDGDGL